MYNAVGPGIDTWHYSTQITRKWIWDERDGTLKSRASDECLTVSLELEVWAAPLAGGSQAVVLLNRSTGNNEQITVNWTDIGFPSEHSALVRDLWARQDLGIFTDHFTSSNISSHEVMMLNITLIK